MICEACFFLKITEKPSFKSGKKCCKYVLYDGFVICPEQMRDKKNLLDIAY
jgi:hypothetical protein